MSQIKSHLSVDSLPYQQYKTPNKNHFVNLATNPSLAFSQSLGFNDSKDQPRKALFNSIEMPKFNLLQQEYPLREDDFQNNSSCITLNPVITKVDIQELINNIKVVAFLTKQARSRNAFIIQKQIVIDKLIAKRDHIEQKMNKLKNQYIKKQQLLTHRSSTSKKLRESKQKTTIKEIKFMKREISSMKQTLSMNKIEREYKKKEELNRRQRSYTNARRDNRKIYIPLVNDGRSINPFDQPYLNYNRINALNFPHYQQYSPNTYLQNEFNMKNVDNNLKNLPQTSSNSMVNKGSKIESQGIITEEDMKFAQSMHPKKIQSYQYQPNSVLGLLSNALNQGDPMSQLSNFKINILKEEERKLLESTSRLQYFDIPLNEQKCRDKSDIRKSRQSLKNMTASKWKDNDEQDSEILSMLQQSIKYSQTSNHGPKQKERPSQNYLAAPKTSQMGNLLIESRFDQSKNITFTLPENSRDKSKSNQHSHNNSNIDICLNQSEQKKNQSMQSNRLPVKNAEKKHIAQSSVNIMINDQSEEPPIKNQSKGQRNSSKYTSLAKQIAKIEEQSEDALSKANTPRDFRDFKIIGSLDRSVESRYTQTPRQAKIDQKRMQASEVYSQTHTIPLKQPPSLSLSDKYEDDDDFMESIKLNSNSKFSQQSPPKSKFIDNTRNKDADQDEDELLGINLIAHSKISRQRDNSMKGSNNFNEQEAAVKKSTYKMTRSEQRLFPPESQNNAEDIHQLLKSSTSSIVKKGSAIQKSTSRSPKGHSKSNSVGSQLFKLSMKDLLSQPIQQAEEEQQIFSKIQVRQTSSNIK